MNQAHNTIDSAMTEIDRLRKILKQRKTKQVYGAEERSLIKATSLAWFNNHRSTVASVVSDDSIKSVDDLYKEILLASDRASVRLTYDGLLKSARNELSKIRAQAVTQYSSTSSQGTESAPPNFDPLITDSQMQEILKNRWVECVNCLSASASLAAIVMMGGLLEALLLARINKETNKVKP